jgi:WD40 repeat protein
MDGSIRIWYAPENRLVAQASLPAPGTCCAMSADFSAGAGMCLHVAVGLQDGKIALFQLYNRPSKLYSRTAFQWHFHLVQIQTIHCCDNLVTYKGTSGSKEKKLYSPRRIIAKITPGGGGTESSKSTGPKCERALRDVKFSPSTDLLAAAGADFHVHIYMHVHFRTKDRSSSRSRSSSSSGGNGQWVPIHLCRGHTACVIHLDWATDNNLLQSMCVGGEILYWSAGACA